MNHLLTDSDEPTQLRRSRLLIPPGRKDVPFFRRTQKINDEFDSVNNSLMSSLSSLEIETKAVRASLDAALREKEDLRRDLSNLVTLVREAVTLCHVADTMHAPPLAAGDDDVALESIDVEDEVGVPSLSIAQVAPVTEAQARKPIDDDKKKVGISNRKSQGTKNVGTPLRGASDAPLTIDFEDPMVTPIPLRPTSRDNTEQRVAYAADRGHDQSSAVVRPFVLDLQPSRAAFVRQPTLHHTSPPPRLPPAWMAMEGLAAASNHPQMHSASHSNDDEDLVVLLLRRQLQQREQELKEMLLQK